ncbi:hypothetical protein M2447_002151 [Ereboglobus sp. PH5-10]|uniref:Uncharacterized protein n=1 Tax=Ereboglobus luteus TaxID=1796921 RepID=A0A2U8E0F2_9BACT|nr:MULTISPECIES: hypothetical protein [Ereboglobus]AWI08337.1 hypothetical protein CKA38_02850 [Ereboglobus luteus]MDF9828043.1 hypothetical protein [Ereboglobus sp. PH5-10]
MAKIDINKVAEILKKNQLDPKLLRQIVEEMNAITQAEEDGEKLPPVKKQFAILVSDPNGVLPKEELAGWVLQLPETESVATVEERIFRGAYDYNDTRKGRQYPVKTVGEAIEQVPAKIFKEAELWVKTKVPVLMLRTNNEIPRELKQPD